MFPDISIVDVAREHHAMLVREAELHRLACRAREATARARLADHSARAIGLPAGPPTTRPAGHPPHPAIAR